LGFDPILRQDLAQCRSQACARHDRGLLH
jgi:hypothetical protein